jgi:hypothetical protein
MFLVILFFPKPGRECHFDFFFFFVVGGGGGGYLQDNFLKKCVVNCLLFIFILLVMEIIERADF